MLGAGTMTAGTGTYHYEHIAPPGLVYVMLEDAAHHRKAKNGQRISGIDIQALTTYHLPLTTMYISSLRGLFMDCTKMLHTT